MYHVQSYGFLPQNVGCSPPSDAASEAASPGSGPYWWQHPSRADLSPQHISAPELQGSHNGHAARGKKCGVNGGTDISPT